MSNLLTIDERYRSAVEQLRATEYGTAERAHADKAWESANRELRSGREQVVESVLERTDFSKMEKRALRDFVLSLADKFDDLSVGKLHEQVVLAFIDAFLQAIVQQPLLVRLMAAYEAEWNVLGEEPTVVGACGAAIQPALNLLVSHLEETATDR